MSSLCWARYQAEQGFLVVSSLVSSPCSLSPLSLSVLTVLAPCGLSLQRRVEHGIS